MKDTARPDRQKLIADTPRLGRPPMPEDQRADSLLFLRINRKEKAAYVKAAKPGTLAAWCFKHLRKAANYKPQHPTT